MQDLLEAIKKNLQDGNYYSVLFLTVMLPSICCALESVDGEDKSPRYIAWYNKYVQNYPLDGEDCYKLRCSLLHQATTIHKKSSFSRVLFTFPNEKRDVFHGNIFEIKFEDKSIKALNLDIQLFSETLISAAEKWLKEVEDSENYKKHIKKTIKTYPDGLSPYFKGIPVIS